ncbi:MAG: outer membrane protein transport protein, partial [Bacteroidales bacterium]|nr:outer membrane protein transport protein [Bacteroidales bacterium]
MKKNLLFIIALFACAQLFAQGGYDGLRLSRNELLGTARGQAMGGAFGALGGDPTSITVNPAGVGVYRSSEVSATFNLSSTSMKSTMDPLWGGSKDNQNKFSANFNSLSVVGYFPTGNTNGPKTVNFAFVYNRLKNLNRNYKSNSPLGMGNSLTDYIATISNGIDNYYFDDRNDPYGSRNIPWLSTLGWKGYLINPVGNNTYESVFPQQSVSGLLDVREKGYVESYDFSLGTNIADAVYLGATFALTNIDYTMSSFYAESFQRGALVELENYQKTDGSGYQLKLGAIWSPTDYLRIGAAYHSPTWYSITDTYWGDTYQSEEGTASTPTGVSRYKFYTPYTWVISVAGILGTDAIISLDYEIRDYKGMDYRDRGGVLDNMAMDQNDIIDQDYRVASTLRLGAEYRFTPQFSGRLGYSFVQNPYEQSYRKGWKEEVIYRTSPHYTIEGDVNYFTAGIGYRFTPQFFMDIAFVYRTQTDKLYYFSPIWDENGGVVVESL